jgi:NADPH:quinone reductase
MRAAVVRKIGPLAEGRYAGLGLDAAGTIDAVGPGVTLEVGTPVIVFVSGVTLPTKAQAEYVVSDLNSIALALAGMDLTLASTLPLNAMTASLALDHLRLRPRDTLLITGAAGSASPTTSSFPARGRGRARTECR